MHTLWPSLSDNEGIDRNHTSAMDQDKSALDGPGSAGSVIPGDVLNDTTDGGRPYASASEQDRMIAGAGTPEQAWRAWPGLAALPEIAASTLVPPGRRAVIVAPHPDDELLGTGGLIATLREIARASSGAAAPEILVVAVTDGTGSHPDSPLWPQERLARVRPAETDAALRCLLGIDAALALPQVVRAGLPDGDVTAHEPALRALLQTIVRANDVVFCSWRLDGHPDHEAVGRAAAQVAESAGATLIELPIWTWHWAQPGDPRVPWERARRLLLSSAVTHAKREATRAYPSQLIADPSTGAAAILPPFVLERVLREFEVFFVPLEPFKPELLP